MKKLMAFTALASFICAPAAFAQNGQMGGKGEKMMEKMFEKSDLDGDGAISKDEFSKASEERFTKLDSNGDGKLTKEEAKQHREEMRSKFQEMKEKRGGASME